MLNRALYQRLHFLFGHVSVSKEGEEFKATTVRISRKEGKYKLFWDKNQKGEFYNINCPYCNDGRGRLAVSYMFGQRDSVGRPMTFLAYCFNEDCLMKEENRYDFIRRLESPGSTPLSKYIVRRGVPKKNVTPELPGDCVPINSLDPTHPARSYLEVDRKFDVDVLSKVYNVSYCEHSLTWGASDRIVIPVMQYGELRGWQARYVGERDWKKKRDMFGSLLAPKYKTMTGMPKSELIYNLDRSRWFDCCVIVEGPTDVWRFGDGSVCTFGTSLSDYQARLLTGLFRNPARPIVLLYDADAQEKPVVKKILENPRLLRHSGGFYPLWLPSGDPGSLNRKFLREFVRRSLRELGVNVKFKQVVTSASA